jgi:hypothetical protein
VVLRVALPARPAAARPAGPGAAATAPGGLRNRLINGPAPAKLRLLLVGLIAGCMAWGAAGAWTVSDHASAAQDVVSVSEPQSLQAQQMYRSLSDADVTATTAFLSGPAEPLAMRDRYQSDIAQAASDLADLKDAAAGGQTSQLDASLAAISTGLPVYTGDVAEAQTDYTLGFPLTGGSFMQVASEEMHLVLLPAARSSYQQENARLDAASAAATGLPWIIVALALAALIALVLYSAQRWLARRTHRVVNYGLLSASAALLLSLVWLITAFAVARTDLHRGVGSGAAPAETLAQADIAAQQGRGDELLNLISRSGDATFEQNFQLVRGELGPGPGSLLSNAAALSSGSPGGSPTAAAAREAPAWYSANEQVYRLDVAANYQAETRMVIGTGPGSSAAAFDDLETDLGRAIAADQVVFQSGAAAGVAAFTGLEAMIVAASVIMVGGCAWGLTLRLQEYRG